MKKRNAQDATRKYDIAPLRARIVALEKQVRLLTKAIDKFLTKG